MTVADNVAAVTPVIEALEALGVDYLIGGSVASSTFGVARSTLDVDIVAQLRPEHVAPLVRMLDSDYYVSEPAIQEAIKRRASCNLIHLDTMVKVDVFILKLRRYDQQSFERRRAEVLDDAPGSRTFFIASVEDIILNKLEWYRLGGEVSERQWTDVVGVMKVQGPTLDRTYLEDWAGPLGVGDLLTAALADAEIG